MHVSPRNARPAQTSAVFLFASDLCIFRISPGETGTGQNKLPKHNVPDLEQQAATAPRRPTLVAKARYRNYNDD